MMTHSLWDFKKIEKMKSSHIVNVTTFVPFGKIENFTVATMTWLTAM
jgi:hypothetical protein